MYEQRYNPYAANVDIMKGYLKSGRVLILGILHFLSLGLSAATLVLNPIGNTVNDLMTLLKNAGIDISDYISGYTTALSSNTLTAISWILWIVVSSLFTLLTAIAFIVMFAKSRSSNPDSNPSSGAGILRVLSLIVFIFTIIGVVAIVALYVLFIISISSVNESFNGDVQSAVTVQVITGIIVSLIIILLISYTASQKNLYRSIKWSLNSVNLESTGAVAYGVWNIILAVFEGLALIASVLAFLANANIPTLFSLATTTLSLVTLIVTASFALGYNSYIKREKYGYNDPYGGSPDPYYPENAPSYGAPGQRGDYHYPDYQMPPQQNMPPYHETPDRHNAAPAQDQQTTCPNCGAPVKENGSFCTNCGFRF